MVLSSSFYRRLPTWYILLAIGEFILFAIRLKTYFSLFSSYHGFISDTAVVWGFTLDWIGSAIPTLMATIIGSLILMFALRTMFHLCIRDKDGVIPSSDSMTIRCAMLLCSRPMNRFVALNCNCPCYIPRPKLRFVIRFILLLFIILLRIIAIILYATSKTDTQNKTLLTVTCTFSLIFPLLSMLLDYYQYRVWWHYRPSCDTSPRSTLSPKHIRYIPYHLVGNNRNDMHMGNEPCRVMGPSAKCPNRNLEHFIIFHSNNYSPQERWFLLPENESDIYIGFHSTKARFAAAIAHSDFRRSMTPPQMLGFGIYFARSRDHTSGKARNSGALICAEVRMGRVKLVTHDELNTVANSNAWWNEYDTVYYIHQKEYRDEFCVKDPAQILRWVIVVHSGDDSNVEDYRLDKEFEDTLLGCI